MNAEEHGQEWLKENLEELKRLSPIQSSKAYKKYVDWCRSKKVKPNTLSMFGGQMRDLHVPKKKVSCYLYDFGDITYVARTSKHTVLVNKEDQPHVEVWHYGKSKPIWTSRRLGIEDGMNAAGEFMLGASNE
jgi:hypothetical protein